MAHGVPAVGRTRTFCQVKVQAAALLGVVTVKTSCVELIEVMAFELPVLARLIFFPAELAPSILTKAAGALVSKMNPLGAFKTMLPAETLATAFSVYTGPVKFVKVPSAYSAGMALPPVAGVNCAGPTVIAGLVLSVFAASVASVAVKVKLPFV